MDSITFFNPESNHKNRKVNITNFADLNNAMDEGGKGIWS
jgi:hypothetical protein